ncbi:MAG: hypothetical protein JSS61_03680 [Verrucomicrobia bacterium]|nr:hypothetical protein [Verrucomicrobiota bacterium]
MTDEELLRANQRGLFPGPHESDADFESRARAAPSYPALTDATALTRQLFDAAPDWVPVHFDKKGLLLWEGAATWIEGSKVSIQVNPKIPFKWYVQKEIIAHELVHAMRQGFIGDRFEEILAYHTSTNRFHRAIGPLFARPIETKGFLILLFTSWLAYWTQEILGLFLGGEILLWLPFLALFICLFRLRRTHALFQRCCAHLKEILPDPSQALAVALRLTQEEILYFATHPPEDIPVYVSLQHTLRWRQLRLCYFDHSLR